MTEFLLELYSEETPARMQENAARELAGKISADAKYYYTPQRIAIVADLPEKQPDQIIDKKGPAVGSPEQAVQGFLKSVGLDSVDKAQTIEEKGRIFYYYKNTVPGKATAEHLQAELPKILNDFTWPKSMRWGDHDIRWVRPLHSIIATLGGKVIPFRFGHIESGDTTRGHRFLSFGVSEFRSFAEYKNWLAENKVIIDPAERRKLIWDEAQKAAGGLVLQADERLLAEVANLVEWPVILVGEFDKSFLDVPQECLIATMKTNQKYFPLFDEDGRLANKFIIVSNMVAEDGGKKITNGNERVIRARLSDAKFFWEQDQKAGLESFLPKLDTVVFHAKVGTLHDKVNRISALARYIANIIGADAGLASRAAQLAKADLVSGMVGEFAELQGLMGAYYAEKQGEKPEVARAIKEHYQPAGQDDAIPTAPVSICVALADKIDSLVQLWEAGEKPTGSRDPFGLRRAALGIIRIILENRLGISLKSLIIQASKSGETGSEEIYEFFVERMKFLLKGRNLRHDYVSAVLDGRNDDLNDIRNKAETLGSFLATPAGENLLAAYKRANNILGIEEKKDKTSYPPEPQENLLEAAEEKSLHTKIGAAEPVIGNALAKADYGAAMSELAQLQPAVNAFFDKVTVNAEKAELRINRLKLLAKIRSFVDSIADFSKIES